MASPNFRRTKRKPRKRKYLSQPVTVTKDGMTYTMSAGDFADDVQRRTHEDGARRTHGQLDRTRERFAAMRSKPATG